jgi:hypothetical protein
MNSLVDHRSSSSSFNFLIWIVLYMQEDSWPWNLLNDWITCPTVRQQTLFLELLLPCRLVPFDCRANLQGWLWEPSSYPCWRLWSHRACQECIDGKNSRPLHRPRCSKLRETAQSKSQDLQWLRTQDRSIQNLGRASQFNSVIDKERKVISNLRWNMSALLQIVPNVWLDSRSDKAID